MESVTSGQAHQVSNTWQFWKRRIWSKFLVENKTKHQILEDLKREGFEVSEAALERKLKDWGYLKNLHRETWRYIEYVLRQRKEACKQTAVILSGCYVPPALVDRKTNRSQIVAYRVPDLKRPGYDLPLYLCTPRGSSNDLTRMSSWPSNLPWLEFCNTQLDYIMSSIHFTTSKSSISQAEPVQLTTHRLVSSQSIQHHIAVPNYVLDMSSPSALFSQLTGRSLINLLGSEKLAVELLTVKSVDLLAARFDLVIPEAYPGENLSRAVALRGGRLQDVQRELLKLLFYLASNNLIFSLNLRQAYAVGFGKTTVQDTSNMVKDASLTITLCRLSGITNPKILHHLITLSQSSYTLTAIIETLYKAAVMAEATDVVRFLLSQDPRIKPDQGHVFPVFIFHTDCETSMGTGLSFAVSRGCIPLIKVLLDEGSDIHQLQYTRNKRLSLIAVAAHQLASDQAISIVDFLLERGANINGTKKQESRSFISPLYVAISQGNVELVTRLIAYGADLNFKMRIKRFYTYTSLRRLQSYEGWASYLDLAVAHTSWKERLRASRQVAQDMSLEPSAQDGKALELCSILLQDELKFQMSPSSRNIRRALVHAIAHGHTKTVSFLISLFPTDLDAKINEFSLLHIAVAQGSLEICETLLRHGLSVNFTCSNYSLWDASLHHHASSDNFCIGVDEKVKNASCCALCDSCIIFGYHEPKHASSRIHDTMSVLQLALLMRRHRITLLLLSSGAIPTVQVCISAAREGQIEILQWLAENARELLQENSQDAYNIALSHGYGAVLDFLLKLGVKMMPSALIWRQPKIHLIQSIFGQSDEVFERYKYDADGRSYLENAILSRDAVVIHYALSLDTHFYDSGSLCAAVRFYLDFPEPTNLDLLVQLVNRRSATFNESQINNRLENVAVFLAVYYQRADILLILLPPQNSSGHSDPISRVSTLSEKGKRDMLSTLQFNNNRPRYSKDNEFDINWHISRYMDCPLHCAIIDGQDDFITLLLDYGYEVDAMDLTMAIAISKLISRCVLLRLISKCNNINRNGPKRQVIREIPLYKAIIQDDLELVEALGAHGAKYDTEWVTMGKFTTPLSYAVKGGNLPMINYFLRKGVDVAGPSWSATAQRRKTVLSIAAKHNYIGLVSHLIAHGAEINPKVDCGSISPLYTAAFNGRLDMVKLFLELGASTNGLWQVQYCKAIWNAKNNGFGAVEEILRSHRQWTGDDEVIWRRLVYNADRRIDDISALVIHPEEFTPSDLLEIIANNQSFSERQPMFTTHFGWIQSKRSNKWQSTVAKLVLQEVDSIITVLGIKRCHVLCEAIQIITVALTEFRSLYPHSSDSVEKAITQAEGEDFEQNIYYPEYADIYKSMEVSLGWFDHPDYVGKYALDVVSTAIKVWKGSFISTVDHTDIGLYTQDYSTDMCMIMDTEPVYNIEMEEYKVPEMLGQLGNVSAADAGVDNAEEYIFEEDWEERRQRAFEDDLAGEEEAPFISMPFAI